MAVTICAIAGHVLVMVALAVAGERYVEEGER